MTVQFYKPSILTTISDIYINIYMYVYIPFQGNPPGKELIMKPHRDKILEVTGEFTVTVEEATIICRPAFCSLFFFFFSFFYLFFLMKGKFN